VALSLAKLRPREKVSYVSHSRTVLAVAADGFIHGEGEQGLFVCQTRLISIYRYRVNGHPLEPVGVSNLQEHSQIAYYIFESPNASSEFLHEPLGPGGTAATESIELRLSRFASDGLIEEVELTNYSKHYVAFPLELEIDADFADASEVHGKRQQFGRIDESWRANGDYSELTWAYTAEHEYEHQGDTGKASLCRSVTVTLQTGSTPTYDRDHKRIVVAVKLQPHESWRCSMLISANIDGHEYKPVRPAEAIAAQDESLAGMAHAEMGTPQIAFTVNCALEQARRDLAALRLHDLDREDGGWTLAGGLPAYVAFFGRDSLTASWQASLLTDKMMRGTLAELAATQAAQQHDWRDAQPGRFVHQIDTGPLAVLRYNPLSRYYGGLTGPGFYPVVLSNLWHWTGDRELIRSFIGPALKGIGWLDRESKTANGFYAYRTRSEQGIKNQAWKDSSDAIVYPDGTQVKDPIAPAEFQAFAFGAKVRMSELMWWSGERDLSKRLFEEAITLRERFNECFWMEDEGCFGMGLDPAGKLIRSVGSESAHAVAAGIVRRDRARRTVERLFQPDLFSGCGVRTLSSQHPRFNPFSYHRGFRLARRAGRLLYGVDALRPAPAFASTGESAV